MQSQISSPGTNLSYAQDYLLQEGNITFARTGASTGKSYIYHKSEGTVYFAGFLIRMIVKDNIDANFIFQNSLTNSFAQYVRFVSQRSGQPGINAEELKAYTLALPSILAEQRLIASYFQFLDTLIQATSKQLASLKQIKAASLQSMFPQEGEMKPRVRFKGFEGEWKKPLISEVFNLRNGYTPSKFVDDYWEEGTIPWFRMEDIRAKGGILFDSIQHITPQAVKGELFKPFSIILATTATIGVHAMLIVDSLANQQFINFSICELLLREYDPYYVYYAFYKIDEWSLHNTNSGGLLSVDIKGLMKQPFYTPLLPEQQKIASYFLNLDRQITLQTRRLEKLKQIKAACLDKMFV